MSKSSKFISTYFDPPPSQWGFRGDPHLWNEMKEKATEVSIPSTEEHLVTLLHNLFFELTAEVPLPGKTFYVTRYDTGGMSRGMISCDFWLQKAFPLVIERYAQDFIK